MRSTGTNWDGGRIPTTFFREALTMALEAIARRRTSRTIALGRVRVSAYRRKAARQASATRGRRAP